MATDYVFHHVARTLSTQDDARQILQRHGGRPAVVSAEVQEAGRGRDGSHWENAPRALSVSVATHAPWPSERLPIVSLVAGLAAREAVASSFPAPFLKWPNDLVNADGGKLGGILTEASGTSLVVGLGMNLWWPDAPEGYAALSEHDVPSPTVTILARMFAETLLRRLALGPEAWGHSEYLDACATVGRDVTWVPAGSGRVVSVDDTGGLVVQTGAGVEVLRSGEVRHVRSQL